MNSASKNIHINQHQIQTLYLDASLGKISSEKFWELLGFKNQYPEIEKYYLDNYILLDKEISGFLEMLDPKTYKLAMLSNDVSEWSIYLRKKFNIEHYFDDFIVSGDVNVRKPDFDIFNIALFKLNANANDCIFVDDRKKNLESAFSLGFNTILFDRENIGAEEIKRYKYINTYVDNFKDLIVAVKNHFERINK